MLGELIENYRCGVLTKITNGTRPFANCLVRLKENALNIANIECVISDQSNRSGLFRNILRAPSSFADLLVEANINVVNLANNHALDHGRAALVECEMHLHKRGIAVIGSEKGNLRQTRPSLLQVAGRQVGVWGFNLANCNTSDRNRRLHYIVSKIREYRQSTDFTVVCMHWGEEYTDLPPPYIVDMAKELAAAGCDILCGHHSHRLQGVTRLGTMLFAPSLGNFVFDDGRKRSRLTAVLEVDIGDVGNWRLAPYWINADFQPTPDPRAAAHVSRLNRKLDDLVEALGLGRHDSENKRVMTRVKLGHLYNQYRMRLRLLFRAWHYRGFYSDLLSMAMRRTTKFSVSDQSDWAVGESNS